MFAISPFSRIKIRSFSSNGTFILLSIDRVLLGAGQEILFDLKMKCHAGSFDLKFASFFYMGEGGIVQENGKSIFSLFFQNQMFPVEMSIVIKKPVLVRTNFK